MRTFKAKWCGLSLGLASSLLVAAQAEAREAGLQPTRRSLSKLDRPRVTAKPSRHWYGWQVLAVDAASIGLLEAGLFSEARGLAFLGLTTFALGPPITHLAQRQGWRAGTSFGMRLSTPVLAYLLSGGSTLAESCGELSTVDCERDWRRGAALAFGAAMLITSAVDSFVLAYRPQRAGSAPSMNFSPTAALLPRGDGPLTATFGVVGTF